MQKQKLLSSMLQSLLLMGAFPAASYATAPDFQPVENVMNQAATAEVDATDVRWNFFDDQVSGELSTVIKTRFTYTNFVRGRSAQPLNADQTDFDVTQGGVIASGTVLDRKFSYYIAGDFVYDGKNNDGTPDAHVDLNAATKAIPALRRSKMRT